MTKKHFEWAAQYSRTELKWFEAKDTVVEAFVALFSKFGENFDKERFVDACWKKED